MSAEKEDEDDYMSDAILQQCQDTRPGLISSRASKLYKREEKIKSANTSNYQKPKKVLEQEKREEGLKSAIGTNNKGFALLQKMGYKPGMTIGKKGEGRSEPVPIEIKSDQRGGLGRETELKRKQAQRIANRTVLAHKRQKIETQLKQDFQQRLSGRFTEQRAEKDLYKSQKVCEQLDSQMDIKLPEEPFYWPLSRLPVKKHKQRQDDFDDDFDEGTNVMNQKHLTNYNFEAYEEEEEEDDEEETEEEDFDDRPDSEKLKILTNYLRSKHKYCIWCGTTYNDDEDLKTNCPGDTAEAHDE